MKPEKWSDWWRRAGGSKGVKKFLPFPPEGASVGGVDVGFVVVVVLLVVDVVVVAGGLVHTSRSTPRWPP